MHNCSYENLTSSESLEIEPSVSPKYFRYVAISPNNKIYGLFQAGFDANLLAKRRNISLEEAIELRSTTACWLNSKIYDSNDEHKDVTFYFTEEGKATFELESLGVIRDALHEGWQIKEIEYKEQLPGEEVYRDKYQVAIDCSK